MKTAYRIVSGFAILAILMASMLAFTPQPVQAHDIISRNYTYTLDHDFDHGSLINLNHDTPEYNQLQLDSQASAFEFIWVAASGRGTILKIDTLTGNIMGEYWSAPQNRFHNPSRTTVDANGNVWAGNRDEADNDQGSIVHIGLKENGQCVDRNGNGVIDTSTGLGDIKPWPNSTYADTNGGVTTAEDECIIHYVRTSGTNVRTVAVDGSNNVWIGGLGNRVHQLYDATGNPVDGTQFNYGCGGYGGLLDGNGVLWSASANGLLLRYDTVSKTGRCIYIGQFSYGLGIDSAGNIWNSQWSYNNVAKLSPAGNVIWIKPTGGGCSRGVVFTADDNGWIANSCSNTVTRLDNNGNLLASIPVGFEPTGVAVDKAGKVWVTNYNSSTAMRIDPAKNVVDVTVDLGQDAYPYNYSDMTGATLSAPPNTGTWTVVHDSGAVGAPWTKIEWNAETPGDSSITVKVASSPDGVAFGPEVLVTNGSAPAVEDGRYLKIIVTFTRGTGCGVDDALPCSPVLYDLTVMSNQPPSANPGGPDPEKPVTYNGEEGSAIPLDQATATDPDGDTLTFAWTYTADADVDAGATCSFSDPAILNPTITCTDDGTFVATLTVDDGVNDPVSGSADVKVTNADPIADITAPAEGALYAINTPVNLAVGYTDAGANDTHTCAIDWNVEVGLPGTGAVDAAAHKCTGTHTYTGAGIYTIKATLTDDDGGESSDTVMVVVYDPSAGFVTGGGWVNSPAGAYVADPTLSGKANFGFVSKYQKGTTIPTGSTEFQFHAGGLNFHSSSYEWLVVTGGNYARFKGTGTINGEGSYKFMIWAGDKAQDTFRIKIWQENELGVETVIYDNGFDQPIAGGSIVVHTK